MTFARMKIAAGEDRRQQGKGGTAAAEGKQQAGVLERVADGPESAEPDDDAADRGEAAPASPPGDAIRFSAGDIARNMTIVAIPDADNPASASRDDYLRIVLASARGVDPAHDQPLAHFVKCRWSRRRIAGQKGNHLARPVQVLLYRGRPMDVRIEKTFQPGPIAVLDRGEDIADSGYLLRHARSPPDV
jgi:hypothetical protein